MKLGILLLCLHITLVVAQSTEDEGYTFCDIPPAKLMGATSLTCTFPEDISLSKKDFSVVHVNSTGKPILDCLWVKGNLECFDTNGYVFNKMVNNTLTIEILKTFSNMTGLYYCKTSTSSSKDVKYCELEILMDYAYPTQKIVHIVIGISVGLMGIGAIIALVILFTLRRRRQHIDHNSTMEARPMLDRTTNLNPNRRREEVTRKLQEHLANKTKEMYQNILDTFYFVPPVYFNKVKYTKQSVANQEVYNPDLPDSNEVRHDLAMRHVLHCLRHVAERGQEKMFVLTQFEYKDYLNNVSNDYKDHTLPVVTSLQQEDENSASVDFLIIHRRHGVFAGVVKVLTDQEENGGDVGTSDVVDEVSNALLKFQKTCDVVSHLMSDQHEGLKIRQLLVVFNIKQSTFQKSLTTQTELLEKLKMCWPICLGQLSDQNLHQGVGPTSLTQFEKLWERVNTQKQDIYRMNDELYLTIIARFCGPATISSLSCESTQPSESFSYQLPKTLDQAVSLTGDMFERFTLYPGMTDLLDKPRICLAGPPGTGKSKMLSLVAQKWISEGHDVRIIYSSPDDIVAVNEFRKRLNSINPSQIQIVCHVQEGKVKNTIEILKESAENHPVFAILDEIDFQKLRGKSLVTLLSKLGNSRNLHVWMAGCTTEHLDIKNPELSLLTVALTCPPSILRQAQQEDVAFLNQYRDSEHPAPTEGPPVKNIYHVGDGHSLEEQPHGCKCCANYISDFLTQTLRTGADDQNNTAVSQETNLQTLKQVSRLKYSDVLILFECDVNKDTPMVKSLQTSGIQMNIISNTEQNYTIEDDTDITFVAKAGQLLGLKRKVVVYVKGGVDMDDASARWNRVRGFTSCTSQLVLVSTPQS
ncbi:uncharacterized protein LOC112575781 isoform X1 [Pomacea canaliculata]|uniref:uncharacterized protein LOC112575781 isoform X1 n=1 Tax=Pomacea canaliculata TaxID=400727 RepID=UPI000D728F6B|nr:uncharacterized protein LOC112575781 isoform X1 [Pomacea canaliculata]